MDISKRLVDLRKKCGYTQNGLAERAGVSQTHLRRVELGQADITVGHLQLLCDAMSISLREFFEEDTIAHVTYSSKKGVSDLDIRIEEKGVTYMAEEENRDLYAGIDLAIDKILGQIRKQKTKILSSRN